MTADSSNSIRAAIAAGPHSQKRHAHEKGYKAEHTNPLIAGMKAVIYVDDLCERQGGEKSYRWGYRTADQWVVWCDAHDVYASCDTYSTARSYMKMPSFFCRACNDLTGSELQPEPQPEPKHGVAREAEFTPTPKPTPTRQKPGPKPSQETESQFSRRTRPKIYMHELLDNRLAQLCKTASITERDLHRLIDNGTDARATRDKVEVIIKALDALSS